MAMRDPDRRADYGWTSGSRRRSLPMENRHQSEGLLQRGSDVADKTPQTIRLLDGATHDDDDDDDCCHHYWT